MNDKDNKKNGSSYDLMQDTQYLLLGLDETAGESYAIEDILAEFSGDESFAPKKKDTKPQAAPAPHTENAEPERNPKIIAFPSAVVPPEENSDDTMVLIDMREYEEEPPVQELFSVSEQRAAREEPEEEEPVAPKPLTMEDIVASTVDAVKAEQEEEQKADPTRRRAEKQRKKIEKKKKHEDKMELPEWDEEQSPREAAAFHKRRWQESRRGFILSVPVLILMWLPWLLEQSGVFVPYFSESMENAAVCVLVAQILLSILSASVFRAALEELRERFCTGYTYAAITDLVALLDAVTLLALPGRSALAPLGGVAGAALVFSLWGLKSYHRGMWETMRAAAAGEPLCVADRCEAGIARGRRRSEGFVHRATLESTASQWQRLLLPPLMAVSVVFALLSSVGRERAQDFLWCWSAVLCASCSFVCPMAYCVPLERVARRLNHSSTAVAGQYGASVLSSASKIVVTDTDLFPRTSVALSGVKLYGEERSRAVSYAATLAVQGGGCMARVFEAVCQGEHIACQPLEHFHIHDDNGLSGMIRGETVLVGTPIFMRHMGVRLPATLPAKTALCLAVDGELTAIFAIKYTPAAPVELALRALARNGLQIILATRDGNVTAKLIKKIYGADGKATLPEISERLALSDPQREADAPNGIIYRDGLLPFVELIALSRRLCQIVKIGNLLSVLGNVFGALLGFYLTFVGRSDALSPLMLMVYLLLWTVPMLPLLIGVDKM
ncbi:MAG: hypothetical protein IKM11_01305 [Oscillospiraceae bacterium]|nr:hypothetical protein [Oscillospiraceae bacterium]